VKIRLVGQNGKTRLHVPKGNPWESFLKELTSSGKHEIEVGLFKKFDFLVMNYPSLMNLLYATLMGIPANRRILVIWEPEVVKNLNFQPRFLQKFKNIFAASPIWAKRAGAKKINWPQTLFQDNLNQFNDWKLRDSKKLVMIQGNKFSANSNEKYSLRREVLSAPEIGPLVDLFGPSWNRGRLFDFVSWLRASFRELTLQPHFRTLKGAGKKYKNYLGEVENKWSVLRNYRYCIVIENSSDFVSEKLFDAVSMGCLPLYVGPNLENFGITLPDVLTCGQEVNDIVDKFNYLTSKSDSELLQLSIDLYNTLKPFSEENSARNVLGKLGGEISKIISD
jgi:hypothetical protein